MAKGKNPKKGERPENIIFGIVATYCKVIHKWIKKYLLIPPGSDANNGFRGWINRNYTSNHAATEWPISSDMIMCQLNNETDLRNFFFKQITVNDRGGLVLAVELPGFIPAIDIKAPKGTEKVNIKLIGVSLSFGDRAGGGGGDTLKEFMVDYNNTPVLTQEFLLDLKTSGKGDFAFIAVAFEFKKKGADLFLQDPKFLPAAVIAMGRLK